MKRRYTDWFIGYYKNILDDNFKSIKTYKGDFLSSNRDDRIIFIIHQYTNYCKI